MQKSKPNKKISLAQTPIKKTEVGTIMAIQHNFLYRTYMTPQNSGGRKDDSPEITIPPNKLPADQFMPLATAFRRRLLTGIGSASLVAVGANFAGTTSFLLGLSPETARNLKLDVIYPIKGFSRCIKSEEGFGW